LSPIEELPNLTGIPRTLLVPLACRALESQRPDALIHDPRSVQVYTTLGVDANREMRLNAMDRTFTVLRNSRFDRYARDFCAVGPSLVVDIGCGLDTRFDRIDDGRLLWLGLDVPEVIALRRQLIPDHSRSLSLGCSMFVTTWMDQVALANRRVIFLAEGVFVYFTEAQVRPLIEQLVERFPGNELVFDVLSSLAVRMHSGHTMLKETGASLGWAVDDPLSLESWGLRLLDRWTYFQEGHPRLGIANLMRLIPSLADANGILHYQLGV
jgi:O-methyltransferase involved in polyketide biosynthesis